MKLPSERGGGRNRYCRRSVTVETDGPAHRAGLLQGDTLVTVDGDPLWGRLDGAVRYLGAVEVDSAHRFGVVRAGELTEVAVTLGEVARR